MAKVSKRAITDTNQQNNMAEIAEEKLGKGKDSTWNKC